MSQLDVQWPSLVAQSLRTDLPHALVEWAITLVVTREGDRPCKFRPSRRVMVELV